MKFRTHLADLYFVKIKKLSPAEIYKFCGAVIKIKILFFRCKPNH